MRGAGEGNPSLPAISLALPRRLWEIAVKHGLGWPEYAVASRLVHRGLLDNGDQELPVTGEHAVAIESLPPIHKDPFDRLSVARAMVEGVPLLTADPWVVRYPAPIGVV